MKTLQNAAQVFNLTREYTLTMNMHMNLSIAPLVRLVAGHPHPGHARLFELHRGPLVT